MRSPLREVDSAEKIAVPQSPISEGDSSKIRAVLLALGWSAAQLARKTGVSYYTAYRVSEGLPTRISPEQHRRIILAFSTGLYNIEKALREYCTGSSREED